MNKITTSKFSLLAFLLIGIAAFSQVVTIKSGFNIPKKVALDTAGNIYILDDNNVKKMDANGNGLTTVGGASNYANDFDLDSSGNIYIAEAVPVVEKMNPGGSISNFLNISAQDGPQGIVVDASNNVFVADTENGQVIKLNSSGTQLAVYSGLNQPSAITLDTAGNIYAGVYGGNSTYSIVKINTSNNSVTTIKSNIPSLPFSLAVDNFGNIFYVEYGGGIKRMTATAQSEISIGSGFNFALAGGIVVDSAGNLYIADTGNGAIKKISAVNLGTVNPGKSAELSISPNPAKDFAVLSNVKKGAKIGLYDVSGRLLYETVAADTSVTLNTAAYKNGMYLVKVDGKASKLLISK